VDFFCDSVQYCYSMIFLRFFWVCLLKLLINDAQYSHVLTHENFRSSSGTL